MSALSSVLRRAEGGRLMFRCPGCHGATHAVSEPRWTWNGDAERPTLAPSIVIRVPRADGRPDAVCHSFVRDGQIEFLTDCTHALAGQTVPIPPFDTEPRA